MMRRKWPAAIAGVLLIAALIVDAGAADFQIQGSFPTPSQAVAVAGNTIYIGAGNNLGILDAANPSSLSLLSSIALTNTVTAIRLDGTLAYVTDSGANLNPRGLSVVNVINPRLPRIIGFARTPGTPADLELIGKLAIVACGGAGFQAVDVTRGTSPTVILGDPDHRVPPVGGGGPPVDPPTAFCLHTAGTRIFSGGDVVRIFDFANPTSPSKLASFFPPTTPPIAGTTATDITDIFVSSNTAYMTHGYTWRDSTGRNSRHWLQLSVFDVSDPRRPASRGSFGPMAGATATSLIVAWPLAYVGWYSPATTQGQPAAPGGVMVLNVGNPAAIHKLANHRAFPNDLALVGDRLYAASSPFMIIRYIGGLTGVREWRRFM